MTACGPVYGHDLYRLKTIPIRFPGCGYYLRWYYNGWHYWFFLPGQSTFQTEGENYRTLGTRRIVIGSGQITLGECAAIRTIMNTREVEIYTDSGWANVRIEPGSAIVKNNFINGYEIELTATLGSRAISKATGYTPIQSIPLVPPVPDPTICQTIIGTQIWMCKNYDINFPGSRVYDNDEANRAIYGGLYTWNQVMTPGYCPTGWHIPSIAEWDVLMVYLGGGGVSGGKLKEVGTTHWNTPNTGATDDYLFTNLPGGYFVSHVLGYPLVNTFDGLGLFSRLWVSDEDALNAYNVLSVYDDAGLTYELLDKGFYFSVRLIKDTPAPSYPSFNDWFLPSKYELNAMYVELYLNGVGGFAAVNYSSSSESGSNYYWQQQFNDGVQGTPGKNTTGIIRPCRAFTSIANYNLRDIGPAGGWIFWKSGNNYLETSPSDIGDAYFSNIVNQSVGTNTIIGTGQANTLAIINQIGHIDSAAKLCDDYVS